MVLVRNAVTASGRIAIVPRELSRLVEAGIFSQSEGDTILCVFEATEEEIRGHQRQDFRLEVRGNRCNDFGTCEGKASYGRDSARETCDTRSLWVGTAAGITALLPGGQVMGGVGVIVVGIAHYACTWLAGSRYDSALAFCCSGFEQLKDGNCGYYASKCVRKSAN